MAGKVVVLELTADTGGGDQTFRFSTRPVTQEPTVLPRMADVPEYRKTVGLWLWNTRSESGVADVELVNADGGLDDLASAVVRDKAATIKIGDPEDTLASFSTVATLQVDRVVVTERRRIRVVFVSPQALLSETLQTAFWTSSVPITVLEGQPIPFAWGKVIQAPAVAYDGVNLKYAITQEPGGPAEILDVSSDGNPALTSQYAIDAYGFDMSVTPSGKVTASFYAVQKQSGHTTSDLASGYPSSGEMNNGQNEDFTSWAGSPQKPTGYTLTNDAVVGPPQTDIRRDGFNNIVRVINNGTSFPYISAQAPTLSRDIGLVPGRWYGVRLEFATISGLNNRLAYIIGATGQASDIGKNGIGVSSDYSSFISSFVNKTTTTGNFLVYYFQATGPAIEFFFGGDAFLGGGANRTQFGLQYLRVWDVVTGETQTVDEAVPYLLEGSGITLNQTDLDNLATEIGTHEIGAFYARQVTRERAVLDALDPFLAWYYFDETATMRFGRLTPPEDQDTVTVQLSGSGSWSVPQYVSRVEVLVVGGGGGGGIVEGNDHGGGGGGGGEVTYRKVYDVTPGGTVSYSVGVGGVAGQIAAGVQAGGGPGQSSTFGDLTAEGGGEGEGYDSNLPGFDPTDGAGFIGNGSGGGAAGATSSRSGQTYSGTEEGNDGGANFATGSLCPGGGGGGAGAAGSDAPSASFGGAGGAGAIYSNGIGGTTGIGSGFGDSGRFGGGGGGGGGSSSGGIGGSGGGGSGSAAGNGGAGQAATGGGGGGGTRLFGGTRGGAGGSGTILVRYTTATPVFEIDSTNIRAGTAPRPRPDLMPGLSDVFGAERNWHVIDEGSAAGALTITEKAEVGTDFRVLERGDASDLDPFYLWAHDRCTVPTTLHGAATNNARDRLARSVAKYRREFLDVSILVDPDQTLNPGDLVFLTYDGLGLESGSLFRVIGVARRYLGRRVDLILWR